MKEVKGSTHPEWHTFALFSVIPPPDIHLLCLHAAAFKLCWVLGSSVDSATAPPRPPLESHSRAK